MLDMINHVFGRLLTERTGAYAYQYIESILKEHSQKPDQRRRDPDPDPEPGPDPPKAAHEAALSAAVERSRREAEAERRRRELERREAQEDRRRLEAAKRREAQAEMRRLEEQKKKSSPVEIAAKAAGLAIGTQVLIKTKGETVFAEVVRYSSAGQVVFRYPNGELRSTTVSDARQLVNRAVQERPRLCVTGAGTKRANGFYRQDGTHNDKPRYRKIGDPDLQLFWERNMLRADAWVICPEELLRDGLVGVITGAVIGVLIGGPMGAAVGAARGGVVGAALGNGKVYYNTAIGTAQPAVPIGNWSTGGGIEAKAPAPTITFPSYDPGRTGTPIFTIKDGHCHCDKELPRGTRVWVSGHGKGVVDSFKRCCKSTHARAVVSCSGLTRRVFASSGLGANEYTIMFNGKRKTLELHKMDWHIIIM